MPSSDPAFDALFEVWTPSNSEKHWRVRFTDGGIAVFTEVLAHEDELRQRQATGTVVREMRAGKGRTLTVGEETWFDLADIKDVTDQALGDIVFPSGVPPRARRLKASDLKARLGAMGLAIVGLLLLVAGVREMIAWNARKKWLNVPAVITSVGMEYGGSRHTVYYATAAYSYTVNGTPYVGTKVTHEEPGRNTLEEAQQLIPFKNGDTVRARVNPKNPAESALTVGDSYQRPIMLMVLVPALLFGAFLWWHSTIPQKSGLYD